MDRTPTGQHDHFLQRIEALRTALQQSDPDRMARQTGTNLLWKNGEGAYHFALWDRPVRLQLPEMKVYEADSEKLLPPPLQALCLFYFTTADGAPVGEGWISFSELPDGRFYNQAYQGYSGGELRRAFGDDLAAFSRAAERNNGEPFPARGAETPGDLAYHFRVLPRVHLLVAAWAGDEDFPSSYQILFDASVSHYLPTDVCAIAGGMLAKRLIR